MTNHRSSWLGRFFSARMCFFQPALFYTLSLDNFEVSTTLFLCASSRSNNGESSCPPGPLPRTAPESLGVIPACCRGEHLCQLFVRPTFRLAYSHGVRPDYDFFESHSFLCFPLFWGISFLDRLSTAFVSDISQWSRACCMLGIFDWSSYFVNWLFTLLRATAWIDCSHCSISSTSHRGFSLCSTEHLWIVSPQPRTPTRRRQSIDVFNHDSTCRNRRHRRESTKEVHGLVVRIAPVSFSTPAILLVHLTLTERSIIYWSQIKWL